MRNLLQESNKGNFRGAINYLLQKNVEVNNNNALNLIISCCTVCTKNECQIDDEALCELLQMCIGNIKELSEAHIDVYLRSMYYIIKYLLDKENHLMVIKLENDLLPSFIPPAFTDQQTRTLLAIGSIIYNTVIQQSRADTYVLKLSSISLKLCVKARSITSYAERVFNFIQVFNSLHVDISHIEELYVSFLSILENSKCNFSEKMSVKPFIKLLQLLVKIFVTKGRLVELKKAVHLTLCIMQKFYIAKEHVLLLKILKAFSCLFAHVEDYSATSDLKKNLSDCYSNLKFLIQLYNQTKHEDVIESMVSSCDTMHFILHKLYYYCYQNVDADVWKNAMPTNVQLFLYKILHASSAFVDKTDKKSSHCSDCNVSSWIFQSINFCTIAAHLYKLSVSKTVYSQNTTSEILARLQRSCVNVNTLKNNKCGKWKEAWIELGGLLYNIGVKLYKQNDMQCVQFIHLFIENLNKLENLGPSIISENIFESSLLCLKEMYLNSKQYQRAMAVVAVQVASCCANTDSAFSEWLRVKLAASENNTAEKETTVLDALQREAEYVKQIYPVELEKHVKIDLLTSELLLYNSRWPTKAGMKNTFKQLHELADCLTSAKVAVQVWGPQKSMHEDISHIMDKLCAQLEQLDEPIELKGFILAGVYFCCYKCKRENLVTKNVEEMKNNAVIPLKPPTAPHEVPLHPNDECDIVTVYEKLNYRTQLKLMKLLGKAVSILESAVAKFSREELDAVSNTMDVLGILYQIGHEYRLHFYRIDCLRSWLLTLAFAEKTENERAVVDSTSFMLEFLNINSESVEKLLHRVDSALNKLKDVKSVENLECIANFHISKSFAYLRIDNLQAAADEFYKSQRVFEELAKFTENCVAKARLYYLHSKFLMLPCSYQIIAHNEVPGVKLYQAFRILKDLDENDGYNSAYISYHLFEIARAMGDVYRWMHLPRELRCYNRDLVIRAQRQLVPYQVAHFLVLLAHADLLSVRIDDSQVKIDGLTSILCIEKQKRPPASKKDPYSETDEDHCVGLVSAFEEISLSAPSQQKCKTNGSPTLPVEQFKVPAFVKHSVACDCFYCACLEYHELVIMKFHLDGLISLHTDRGSFNSLRYFSGVLQMHGVFVTKSRCIAEKFNQLFGEKYLQDTACLYYEALSSVLLDYGRALLSTGRKTEAIKINDDLRKMVTPKKLQNVYLYNEAIYQQLGLLWDAKYSSSTAKNTDQNTDAKVSGECKTPEPKVTIVPFPKSVSPKYNMSFCNKTVKHIPFDFGDTENDVTNQKPEPPKQTPCVIPSIKVEVHKLRTSKKTKKALIPPVTKTDCLRTKVASGQFLASPTSADTCTPDFVKLSPMERTLRKKTKLLTKKIKNKKPVDNEDDAAQILEDIDYDEKKSSVMQGLARKNLMDELCECKDQGKKKVEKEKTNGCQNVKKSTTRSGRTVKKRVV